MLNNIITTLFVICLIPILMAVSPIVTLFCCMIGLVELWRGNI